MIRLDRLLSNLGYCSRRDSKTFLATHQVTVGGTRVRDSSAKVLPTDEVLVSGKQLDRIGGILLALWKPVGLVCSHSKSEGSSIYDLLPDQWRLRRPIVTSVGRLDKDTSGLIVLTDQSLLVHQLTSPLNKIKKVYEVTVNSEISPRLVSVFASGTLRLNGEKSRCAPAAVKVTSPTTAEVTLEEGKYHQVRRMFASQGYEVLKLHRSRFDSLTLEGLSPGEWRELPLDYFK